MIRCFIGNDVPELMQTIEFDYSIEEYAKSLRFSKVARLVINVWEDGQLVVVRENIYGVYSYRIGRPCLPHARIDQIFKQLRPKHITML